jgi:hypothetical protein
LQAVKHAGDQPAISWAEGIFREPLLVGAGNSVTGKDTIYQLFDGKLGSGGLCLHRTRLNFSLFTMPHRDQALGDFNRGKTVRFFGLESDANRKENVTKYLAVSDAGHCKGLWAILHQTENRYIAILK